MENKLTEFTATLQHLQVEGAGTDEIPSWASPDDAHEAYRRMLSLIGLTPEDVENVS